MSPADPAPAPKRRHFIEAPRESEAGTPVWRRAWFWLFAAAILLVLLPLAPALAHILGPDDAPQAKVVLPDSKPDWDADEALAMPLSYDGALTRVVAARVAGSVIAALPPACGDAAIRSGARFDEKLTPAFLAAVEEKVTAKVDAAAVAAASGPACRLADILASDGEARAAIALGRSRRDAGMIADEYLRRLLLARSLVFAVSSRDDFLAALLHEREVLAEVRFDAELLSADPAALKKLLPALAAHAAAPSRELTGPFALGLDAALDVEPDAGLRAMRDKSPAPADATRFERIARFARKPEAYRSGVSALLANFGRVLAMPVYREAVNAMRLPGSASEVSLAGRFLRKSVFEKLGGSGALGFFFPAIEPEDGAIVDFALKFDAFTASRDIEGIAYLAYRRADLLVLLAHFEHTRFDAGATAYALGLRHRRLLEGGDRWPKDTDGIFEGLMDVYPLDPFTDEPVAYSRKNLTLHSPGADLNDANGLPDAEFATESETFWEPTIPLEPERPTDPAAFGLHWEKQKPATSSAKKPAAPAK